MHDSLRWNAFDKDDSNIRALAHLAPYLLPPYCPDSCASEGICRFTSTNRSDQDEG
ncbi:hypothetical protein V5O48_015446, partial [Marasmius crinis-equi]